MPNLIYVTTQEALSALVSPRAATSCLNSALAGSRQDSDTITSRAMRSLLAGPIRRELSSALPKQGLTRSLKKIASTLAALEPSAAVTIVDAAVDLPEEDIAGLPSDSTSGESVHDEAKAAHQGVFGTGGGHVDDQARTTVASPRPTFSTPLLALDEERITAALHLFGEQEAVQQVVFLRGSEVVLNRGSTIATERLPNLVSSTRHLLARVGNLRAFALERSSGVLFVFPVGSDSIVVVTEPDVNIGAVLTARAALEEAA